MLERLGGIHAIWHAHHTAALYGAFLLLLPILFASADVYFCQAQSTHHRSVRPITHDRVGGMCAQAFTQLMLQAAGVNGISSTASRTQSCEWRTHETSCVQAELQQVTVDAARSSKKGASCMRCIRVLHVTMLGQPSAWCMAGPVGHMHHPCIAAH
jgi:hypothetical protein